MKRTEQCAMKQIVIMRYRSLFWGKCGEEWNKKEKKMQRKKCAAKQNDTMAMFTCCIKCAEKNVLKNDLVFKHLERCQCRNV